MKERIISFSPGPAAIPLPVLEKVEAELLNYQGSGMSVLELSHRSKWFDEILETTIARLKRLMGLGEDHQVLFIQGGASMQFAMVPLNLCGGKRPAYINTGTWSTKAIAEAELQGKGPITVASSEDRNFAYIPREYEIPNKAAYLHLTSNNTIKGTQFRNFPQTSVPLVVDMSSDILSRPFDPAPFGFIYAGAQKNLGPAGAVVAIIRKDMLERTPDDLPTMFRYTTYAAKDSRHNTPPCFTIYVIGLVLEWLENEVGGVEKADAMNQAKAGLLYRVLDESGDFYRPTADKDSRSLMNVTFRLADEALEAVFVAQALDNGLGGLKGHKSVGGCRASIYNALSLEEVKALADFMTEFARKKG